MRISQITFCNLYTVSFTFKYEKQKMAAKTTSLLLFSRQINAQFMVSV